MGSYFTNPETLNKTFKKSFIKNVNLDHKKSEHSEKKFKKM